MIETLFPPSVVSVVATPAMYDEPLHPAEADCVRKAEVARRREFAAGRACARRALATLGIEDFPLLVGADRAPVWPTGVVGSISHCDDYCAAAVAPLGAVVALGLDAETDDPLDADLIPRVCSGPERRAIAELSAGGSVEQWAKLIFSAKESVAKCLAATDLEFAEVEIRLRPNEGAFDVGLDSQRQPFAHLEGRFARAPGVVLTGVCARSAAHPPVIRKYESIIKNDGRRMALLDQHLRERKADQDSYLFLGPHAEMMEGFLISGLSHHTGDAKVLVDSDVGAGEKKL